jgi:molecular chaperone HscB
MDFKQNHFELFGLPTAFRIDSASLELAYRSIQSLVHPDRFADRGETEKRLSMQWTTHANEAYQTLKSPLPRARYLLQLKGIDALSDAGTAMPAAFLMQQMEWRDAIAVARSHRNRQALDELIKAVRSEVKRMEVELASLLDDSKDDGAAVLSVRKLRFLCKLLEEIGDAQEELELA